jgi:catechol O-methyltransferase
VDFLSVVLLSIQHAVYPIHLTYPHTLFSEQMAQFDDSKAYASQEDVFFDDGRETELLRFIYDKPNIDEIRGSPEKVLAAIDEFGRTQKYLMNVGEDKGKIVSNLIAEVKPETMVRIP